MTSCTHPQDTLNIYTLKSGGKFQWCRSCGAINDKGDWEEPAPKVVNIEAAAEAIYKCWVTADTGDSFDGSLAKAWKSDQPWDSDSDKTLCEWERDEYRAFARAAFSAANELPAKNEMITLSKAILAASQALNIDMGDGEPTFQCCNAVCGHGPGCLLREALSIANSITELTETDIARMNYGRAMPLPVIKLPERTLLKPTKKYP